MMVVITVCYWSHKFQNFVRSSDDLFLKESHTKVKLGFKS